MSFPLRTCRSRHPHLRANYHASSRRGRECVERVFPDDSADHVDMLACLGDGVFRSPPCCLNPCLIQKQ